MILVFGGAYQGKTDYALQEFGAETVCDISEAGEPDFNTPECVKEAAIQAINDNFRVIVLTDKKQYVSD